MSQDILERLKADHDKHRTLLDLVEKTQGDSEGRRELFARLRDELTSHAEAEERSLYALLLGQKEGQGRARHSVHEHEQIDDLVLELADMDFSSPGWLQRFRTLADKVRHHMEEEEQDVFPLAAELLTESEKDTLARRFNAVKALA